MLIGELLADMFCQFRKRRHQHGRGRPLNSAFLDNSLFRNIYCYLASGSDGCAARGYDFAILPAGFRVACLRDHKHSSSSTSSSTLVSAQSIVYIWGERRILGRIQNRTGPNRWGPFGTLTSVADAIKTLFKEDIVPDEADRWLFNLAPILMVFPVLNGVVSDTVRRRNFRRRSQRRDTLRNRYHFDVWHFCSFSVVGIRKPHRHICRDALSSNAHQLRDTNGAVVDRRIDARRIDVPRCNRGCSRHPIHTGSATRIVRIPHSGTGGD